MNSMIVRFIEHTWFTRIIVILILINAVILGLETYPSVMRDYGIVLQQVDHVILWIFVGELSLRLVAYRGRFFHDPWSLFDLAVVGIAFMPASEAFAVLRAARVLRVLRLISAFPSMRRVVQGLLSAIPGIGSIGAILAILFYIFSVIATKLFGADYPHWFGSLQSSLFSLFQIMTLEGWADMVREIMKTHPLGWIFFILYILISTFTVLNLFIAVIVDTMQRQQHEHVEESEEIKLLKKLRKEVAELKKK